MKLNNLTVVDGSAWKLFRGVEVTALNMHQGTLKRRSIDSYTLYPTFEDHAFMREIGYSKYYMAVTVEAVSYSAGTVTLSLRGMPDVVVKMAEDDFIGWHEFAGRHIGFYKEGEKMIKPESNLDWLTEIFEGS